MHSIWTAFWVENNCSFSDSAKNYHSSARLLSQINSKLKIWVWELEKSIAQVFDLGHSIILSSMPSGYFNNNNSIRVSQYISTSSSIFKIYLAEFKLQGVWIQNVFFFKLLLSAKQLSQFEIEFYCFRFERSLFTSSFCQKSKS